MPVEKLKCRCGKSKKCSAPLHGQITIIGCKKSCKLGCDKPIKK